MHNNQSRALSFKEDRLFFQNHDLLKLANRWETPFYLYSAQLFKTNYLEFVQAAQEFMPSKEHFICYALKANPHPRLLGIIAKEGAGADVVSGGELKRALECGISAKKIVFSGVGKTKKEIAQGLKAEIKSFNVESLEELKDIQEVSKNLNIQAPIALRLNPDVQAKTHKNIATGAGEDKFGLSHENILKAYRIIQSYDNLKLVGLSVHIGSQLTEMQATREALDQLLDLSRSSQTGLEFIDIGGGLGIDYEEKEKGQLIELKTYMHELSILLNNSSIKQVIFEPGRFIAAKTGLLISKVIRTKEQGTQNFAIIDAGMNDMARVSLYEAYHRITPLLIQPGHESKSYHIVGPVCESTDVFARSRNLASLKQDDYLIIHDVGAYGKSMASNYNLRPSIEEYFVEDI